MKQDSSLKEDTAKEIPVPEKLLKELFDGVYKTLDTISNLLQQQVSAASKLAPPSPNDKAIVPRVERRFAKEVSLSNRLNFLKFALS